MGLNLGNLNASSKVMMKSETKQTIVNLKLWLKCPAHLWEVNNTYPNLGQDQEVLKLIEREIRMQEGACKLLAACSQREQALEASKSLLTCNARILALLSQLQKMRKAEILEREGFR